MSIQAITWVLKQDIARSSLKFLLVALANYADQTGICFPSQDRLAADTGQDRKTVLQNLRRLVELGYLRDTGHRVGPTRSVVVHQIVGLSEAGRVHYIYKTIEPATGQFYIGKRSFDGEPEQDIYRGSGQWVLERQSVGAVLVREIVTLCQTAEEAAHLEQLELRKAETDPLCKNRGTPRLHRENGLRQHAEWFRKRDGSANEESRKRDSSPGEAVPFFPSSCTVFPVKVSQKRDLDPSIEPSSEPSKESLFGDMPKTTQPTKPQKPTWPADYRERFWETYPRKVGKAAAIKALERPRKDGVSWDKFIKAVERFARECAGKDIQYVPHPATWLNAGRWDDEPNGPSPGGGHSHHHRGLDPRLG